MLGSKTSVPKPQALDTPLILELSETGMCKQDKWFQKMADYLRR